MKENIIENLKSDFIENLKELNKRGRKPEILLCGRKGTGKRELISLLFDFNSKGFDKNKHEVFETDYIRITIFDIEESDNYRKIIEEKSENIDLFWYTSTVDKLLKKEWDYHILEELERYSPTALLITGCHLFTFKYLLIKNLKKIHEKSEVPLFPIFNMNRKLIPLFNGSWNDFFDWSLEVIEEDLQEEKALTITPIAPDSNLSFLDDKRLYVKRRVIPAYVSAAGVIGASPIPFSDAFLLVPEQVTMAIHIMRIYGIEESRQVVTSLISSTVLSRLGKALSSALLKIIPGVGTIVGGAINASVASGLTFSLGHAVSTLSYNYKKALLSGERVSFNDYFNIAEMKKAVNRIEGSGFDKNSVIENNISNYKN